MTYQINNPEDKARHDLINPALEKSGWKVQHFKTANIYATKGVAVEYFQMGKGVGEADYVYYFLMSKTKELQNINQGAAQPNLNTSIIKNIIIPIGSIEELQDVVEEIESRFSVIEKLEQVVDASLDKAEQLRKSILKTAFEGKLVKEVIAQ